MSPFVHVPERHQKNPATRDGQDCQSCDAGFKLNGNACVAFQSTCTNGTKKTPATRDGQDCQSCDAGYRLNGNACVAFQSTHERHQKEPRDKGRPRLPIVRRRLPLNGNACVAFQSTCTNGTKKNPATRDGQDCQSCDAGFKMNGNACVAFQSTCPNGTKKNPATRDGQDCQSCDAGFKLNGECLCRLSKHVHERHQKESCDKGRSKTANRVRRRIQVERECLCRLSKHVHERPKRTLRQGTARLPINAGYKLNGNACVAFQSTCTNGTKKNPATRDGQDCESCNLGYTLDGNECIAINCTRYAVGTTTKQTECCPEDLPTNVKDDPPRRALATLPAKIPTKSIPTDAFLPSPT